MGDKLKLGILDLLTILVLGGFLLIFIRPFLQGYIEIIARSFPTLSSKDPVLYAGFIAIAYILGCFIYFIASYLDSWVYENVSKVFWHNPALVAYIVDFKTAQTGIPGRKVINAFKWSCAWLLKHHPSMYDEVERVFSLVRYLTQRKKSVSMAYEYVITATEKQFSKQPDPEAYYEVSKRNIAGGCDPDNDYEPDRSRLLVNDLSCFFKKLGKVLQLCLNPFYNYPVAPKGTPSSKSTELRWFTKINNEDLARWFDDHIDAVGGNIEKRTDTYYLKSDMEDSSIKKRNGKFEIKQRIAAIGKVHLSDHICGEGEYWYKWILNDAEAKSLEANLEQNHYRQLQVTKIRRALKLTIDPGNKQIKKHAMDKDLPEGFQIEYTSILMNDGPENGNWYSFAIESFGSKLPGLSALEGLDLPAQVHFRQEDSYAYPVFLPGNFLN